MFRKVLIISITCTIAGVALGCGGGDDSPRPKGESAHNERPAVEGSLVESVERTRASEYVEDCDRQDDAIKLELARVLDARKAEIDQLMRALPSTAVRNVPIGPTYFTERTSPLELKTGWRTVRSSWREAYQDYLKIKDRSVDIDWLNLNIDVRSLAGEDEDRLLLGYRQAFGRKTGELMNAMAKKIETATKAANYDTTCPMPALNSNELQLIDDVRWYTGNWNEAKSETANCTARKEALDKVVWDLRDDYNQRYATQKSVAVRRQDEKTYVVRLAAGDYAGAEAEFERLIEGTWKSNRRRLKVEWVPRGTADAFELVFKNIVGERAGVYPKKQQVHFYPGTPITSVAHEIGHVIGFHDHYYTTWNRATCGYEYEMSAEDIMSDSSQSFVPKEHWDTLDATYPLR